MSTKKRILRNIGILIPAVILGGVVGFMMDHFEHISWPTVLNVELLKNIGRASLFILYPVTFFLLYQTHKVHGAYQREEDDDRSYELYRQTFKTLEYATILYNISSALTLFTLFVGVSYLGPLLRSETAIHIPFYDIALFLALILGQILVLKTTQKVRQYKLSAMPTIEEMKDYALSYDEGELQAHYEQSFLTLFNLNQRLIPGLYILLFILGVGTPMQVVSGMIVLTIIFVYINVDSYQAVKRYFK
ncbi:DUF3169 family protein [Streptococcus sp. SC1]|uniref:DUF3169 family protein n=1 Tax=Streptococcus TaxID=1301 RepID=UPI00255986B5|nr:DUF3169 family protein [Streptococcus sp. SC1]MDL2432600.1 DUF3169 family protein [Streptococcus sp. SC1]